MPNTKIENFQQAYKLLARKGIKVCIQSSCGVYVTVAKSQALWVIRECLKKKGYNINIDHSGATMVFVNFDNLPF